MTADRLPTRRKPMVAENYDNFLDHMEEIEKELPSKANCPNGHTLALTSENLDWPADEGIYLLGPTPVYKDVECQTTFVSSSVLSVAEGSLKASVKSPDSYVFTLPSGVLPLTQ